MSEKELKILIFGLNDELFATDIMDVERILGYEVPTKLPDAPDYVVGVINYQGSILPVISLAKKFNLSSKAIDEDTKIVVAKQNDEKIGVIVENVSEVRDVNRANIEAPPVVVSGISKRYMNGIIKLDNKIILFLNLSNILTEDEKKVLK
ncbi:MAG: purine-binding chemotaxis protein CheW [Clostridiaceae bacterium]|nr:purine-binding chemotaxis protein CheW [Clostridiaceae bacterium]